MQYLIKIVITVFIVVAVSESAKHSKVWGAIIASLPLTSVLAISWLYYDTGDKAITADLAGSILFMVLPSLVFFIVLPFLLRRDCGFAISLTSASGATALLYATIASLMAKP